MNVSNVFKPLYQCRLCMKDTPTRVNVFGGDFPKMFEMLTSIKVYESDGLPKFSCKPCAEDLKSALVIKRRFIKSHKLLKDNLKKNLNSSAAVFIIDDEDIPIKEIVITNQNDEQLITVPKQPEFLDTPEFVDVKEVKPIKVEKTEEQYVSDDEIVIKTETNSDPEIHLDSRSLEDIIENFVSVAGKPQANKPDPFYCSICKIRFKNKMLTNRHRNKHKLKKCDLCNKVVRSDNFKKHLLLHSDGPKTCKMCGAVCKNIESLRGHIFYQHKHTSDEYMCEECGKPFRTKAKLSLHQIKAHLGLRNFKCETCGKAFFTRSNLNSHVNMTHKKLRPYFCEFCGTGFSSAYALKTHKRQHTNEKPFKCTYCDEGFRQKVSLRSHMKSKHGYEEVKQSFCDQCGKGFATDYALNVHVRLHGSQKCEMCSESFADREYLTNHLREKHNIDNDSKEETGSDGNSDDEFEEEEN